MLPLFLLPPLREGIRIQKRLRGIKQIASASININGPWETWKFPRCSLSSEWMESKNQLKGGVMRYINQMLAELRRLYSNLCCLKLSVRPSAGDQDAESTGDRNLLTLQQLTHIPCKHTFWRFHPRTVTNGRLPPVQLVILNHNLHPWRKPGFVWCVWWGAVCVLADTYGNNMQQSCW